MHYVRRKMRTIVEVEKGENALFVANGPTQGKR